MLKTLKDEKGSSKIQFTIPKISQLQKWICVSKTGSSMPFSCKSLDNHGVIGKPRALATK